MKLSDKLWPLTKLYIYLSGNCNLECRHCWIDPVTVSGSGNGASQLELSVLKRTVTEAKALGLKSVKLTGGEPFLYPDINSFIKWLGQENIDITIETNGTLLGEREISVMKESGVSRLAIALDGSDENIHRKMRGRQGCFDSTVDSIRAAAGKKLNVQVIFSLWKQNVGDIRATAILAEELGAKSFKINPVAAISRGRQMSESNETLSVEEILELRESVFKLAADMSIPVRLDIPVAFLPLERIKEEMSVCRLKNIMGVLSDGSISICGIGVNIKELILGSIYRDSLTDIWKDSNMLNTVRTGLPGNLQGICAKCVFRYTCLGKCRAEVFAREKDLFKPHAFCKKAAETGIFPATRAYDGQAGHYDLVGEFVFLREKGGALLFNPSTGFLGTLNDVGALIVESISSQMTKEEIICRIVDIYSVDRETAEDDFNGLLERLRIENIL
ncbi:MAG: PqqD family peptide modification chaperone [Elusimicrobiota bacterium]